MVVQNPGDFSARLPASYTYALPDAFDFNGDWIGHAGQDFVIDMRFTIQNNVLVSLSCGMDAVVTLSAPLRITDGRFSFAARGFATAR